MARTFARFQWIISLPEDDEPPYAEHDVTALVSNLRAAGFVVSAPEPTEYSWEFDCELAQLNMACELGVIGGEPERWLLACRPVAGRADRESEQVVFARRIGELLTTDNRIVDLRWYSPEEWDAVGS
jgi:hypothetical protein